MASGSSEGRRKDFEDLLHCMICFEPYRSPKMLTCGHTFCAECLSGYLKTYQQQKRAVAGKLPCPTCRELTALPSGGIAGLRNDFKVKKIEEMFKTVNITKRVTSLVCDPCKSGGKSTKASIYCPNCAMNYCTGCLKKHSKNSLFRSHQVINKGQDRASDVVCKVHSNERGRYFCRSCEMIVCTICIVQGHDGHNVCEIDALWKQHKSDVGNLQNIVESKLSKLKKKASELETLRQINLSSCQQGEIDIKERTKVLIDTIRQEESTLLKELHRRRDDKLKLIAKEIERVKFHVGKAFSLSEFADKTVKQSSVQMIAVHEEFIQRMRTVAESDFTLPDTNLCTVVTFHAGRVDPCIGKIGDVREDPGELSQAAAERLRKLKTTQQLSVDASPSNGLTSHPRLLVHINRYGTAPGEIRDPLGVACLLNGDLVVTEWANKRVQLFDSVGQSVEIIGARQLEAPQGVSVTLRGNIIITDGHQKRLSVFSPSGNCLAKWGLGKFFTPCGICISPNGNCVVTDAGEHSVSVFQGERTCLKRFGSQGNGDYKFKNPLYVTTGQHNEIIVSDSDNHCIKMYDSTGKHLGKFGGQGQADGQLHFPRGVCTDSNGNIIVADRNNHRVSLFASNGFFLRHLLTKADGLRDPYAVAVSITGNLVVTESASDRAGVKVFQL